MFLRLSIVFLGLYVSVSKLMENNYFFFLKLRFSFLSNQVEQSFGLNACCSLCMLSERTLALSISSMELEGRLGLRELCSFAREIRELKLSELRPSLSFAKM